MTDLILDTFALAYVEAALWSSTDEDGEPLDGVYTIDDIHADTLAVMVADCDDFQLSYGFHFEGRDDEAGHDFWLTRNGHGAGFWDGDWDQAIRNDGKARPAVRTIGEFLASMSRPYGSFDLYVGDDGMIHGS